MQNLGGIIFNKNSNYVENVIKKEEKTAAGRHKLAIFGPTVCTCLLNVYLLFYTILHICVQFCMLSQFLHVFFGLKLFQNYH